MTSSQTLIVDNYDSFTFNLVHLIEAILNEEVIVKRVDDIAVSEISDYENIVFSPGPGLPDESTNLLCLVSESMRLNKRVLGVCLGFQAMAIAEGAKLKNLQEVHHGVSHPINILRPKSLLFGKCGLQLMVGRYHSWVIDETELPDHWIITSRDDNGEVMSIEHGVKPFYGIQFHPESVLTPEGRVILEGFFY